MTLRQLKAFLTIAQTLSFAEASERLYISQPALSLAIKKLEESIGGRLIVRTTRTVNLTPEGHALYEKGVRLLNGWEAVEYEMKQRFQLQRGTVSIASMPSFAANQLPEVIKLFKKKYPNINVTIEDVIAEETVKLVREGKVEIGVTFRPPGLSETDEFTQLCMDRFVAIIPQEHHLNAEGQVNWKQILKSDFIALQKPSMVRMLIEKKLEEEGINFDVGYESHQLSTIGRLVSNGLGVSVVPSLCARQMQQLGATVLPINTPEVTCDLGILTKQKKQLSVPARAMFDVLQEYFSQNRSSEHQTI